MTQFSFTFVLMLSVVIFPCENIHCQRDVFVPTDYEISYMDNVDMEGVHPFEFEKASPLRIKKLFKWNSIIITNEDISFVGENFLGDEDVIAYWLKDFDQTYATNDVITLSLHGENESYYHMRFKEKEGYVVGELIDLIFYEDIYNTKYTLKYIF